MNETEKQMLERANETGAYPVAEWLLKSWLPWKQEKLKKVLDKN